MLVAEEEAQILQVQQKQAVQEGLGVEEMVVPELLRDRQPQALLIQEEVVVAVHLFQDLLLMAQQAALALSS
jgi:hypothetical protein